MIYLTARIHPMAYYGAIKTANKEYSVATVYELAKLSAIAYRNDVKHFRTWSRITYRGNPSGKGFYSEIYKNPHKRQIAVCFRGTDGENQDWNDLIADVQIFMGKLPHQFDSAQQTFHDAQVIARREFGRRHSIILSGHSLGGGLASLVSVKNGVLPTVTFNAPGMYRSYIDSFWSATVGHINYRQLDTSKMIHIRATGDPISVGTGTHMGKVEKVYVDSWGDRKVLGSSRHLAQHSIENMVESLQSKWHYNQPLNFE